MGTYPTAPRSDFLSWCQLHEEIFTDHAAAIGLTPAQALAFKTATDKAADAASKQESYRSKALSATSDANDAFATLRTAAGATVRLIRTFAENAPNPQSVYSTAEIPPPAAPSPVPPPARPTDLRVQLDAAIGNLTLRWKASNPQNAGGTSYVVRRRLPGESDWTIIAITGSKKFIDTTLLAGPDMVQYTVQGQRSELSGPVSEVFTVNFGRLPSGVRTASVARGGLRDGNHAPATQNVGGRFIASSNGNGNGASSYAAQPVGV